MKKTTFIKLLKEKEYLFKEENEIITIIEKGSISFGIELTELPDDIIFKNIGNVELPFVNNIFKNVTFLNKGNVKLPSLINIGENIVFKNNGFVKLNMLKTLNSNTIFQNKSNLCNEGGIDLQSLKSLPEIFTFNNEGYIYLDSLEFLPMTVVFNNKNVITLSSLTVFNNQKIHQYNIINISDTILFDGRKVLLIEINKVTYIFHGFSGSSEYLIYNVEILSSSGYEFYRKKLFIANLKDTFSLPYETEEDAISSFSTREYFNKILNIVIKSNQINKHQYMFFTNGYYKFVDEVFQDNDTLSIEEAIAFSKDTIFENRINEIFSFKKD